MPKEETTQKAWEKNEVTAVTQDTQTQNRRTKTDFVELAKERNARVILHNTPDTYPLTDMARYADQGIRRLRNRIMISITPEDALPLLNEYNESLLKLHTIVSKICAVTHVKYKTPRALMQVLGKEVSDAAEK